MILDDDEDFLELLSYSFQHAGYEVATVSSPHDVTALIREFRPELIILDLHLAGMDGVAVCEGIRSVEIMAGVPILFLTGCTSESVRMEALDKGGTDYMFKPVSPRDLVQKVRELLASLKTQAA